MRPPRPVVVEDAEALAAAGADVVCEVIAAHPAASIVVPTGETPMGVYARLAERRRAGTIDTSSITVIQLDEYLGLGPGDRRSLFGWMRRSFLDPLEIDDGRVVRLPLDGDLAAACSRYDLAMEARGPVDLAILGLGLNGHLGFNEPPSGRAAPTREVRLSAATIDANAGYWGSVADVPSSAVTLGMRHLLAARRILLLVSGARKHAIVHRALEGPTGPDVPASFVQDAGGDVTVIVDRAAWDGG